MTDKTITLDELLATLRARDLFAEADFITRHLSQPAERGEEVDSFQTGVEKWVGECFIPSLYSNMTERGDRLLEEVLELLQSKGYDRNRVATLVDYVYGRPVGDPAQEVGGVMVTLAGLCWIAGIDMRAAGNAELSRITKPEVMAKIRAKQEAKNALHFDTPLPGNAPPPAAERGEAVGKFVGSGAIKQYANGRAYPIGTEVYPALPPAAGVPDMTKIGAPAWPGQLDGLPPPDGWSALSATPSPTIDVAAVRDVIAEHRRQASMLSHDHESRDYLLEQADKLARAIGDAK